MSNEEIGAERRTIIEVFSVLARRWRLVAALVMIAALGALVQHVLFPKYVAKASLIVRTDVNSPLLRVFGKISGAQENPYGVSRPPSDEMMKILRSNSFSHFVKERVLSQLQENAFNPKLVMSMHKNVDSIDAEIISDHILHNYELKQLDDVIGVSGFSREPEEAELVVQWILDSARIYLVEYETKEVLETEKYLRKEIQYATERIISLNDEIDKFRNDPNQILSRKENESGAIDRSISKIREDLEMVRVRTSEIDILSETYADRVRQLRKLAAFEEDDKLQVRGRFIDGLKMLSVERENLSAREKSLTARLTGLIATLKPQNEQAVFDLRKTLEVEHDLRQELQRQVYATHVYLISAENKIRNYETVQAGSAKSSISLMKKFALAILLAVLSAIILIFVWEQMYPVMSLKHDFLHFGVRFLGSVPLFFQKKDMLQGVLQAKQTKTMFQRMGTVLRSEIRTSESTAIQFLAARLLHNLEKLNGQRRGVISVLSCNSGEGKTLLSNCLAATFGHFGVKVLLVEGDTLRSKGDNIFGIGMAEGFAEALENPNLLESLIQKTEFKNVDYCTRGLRRPNVSLLQAETYKKFLTAAQDLYDVVIVDTPAFAVGPEALLMANGTNLELVIASAHQTHQSDFSELVESLHARGIRNIYAVLNRSGHRVATAEAYYYNDKIAELEKAS